MCGTTPRYDLNQSYDVDEELCNHETRGILEFEREGDDLGADMETTEPDISPFGQEMDPIGADLEANLGVVLNSQKISTRHHKETAKRILPRPWIAKMSTSMPPRRWHQRRSAHPYGHCCGHVCAEPRRQVYDAREIINSSRIIQRTMSSTSRVKNMAKRKCFICKVPGHIAKDCMIQLNRVDTISSKGGMMS